MDLNKSWIPLGSLIVAIIVMLFGSGLCNRKSDYHTGPANQNEGSMDLGIDDPGSLAKNDQSYSQDKNSASYKVPQKKSPPKGKIYDRRDGTTYNTVQIGQQTWIQEDIKINGLGRLKRNGQEQYYKFEESKNVCPEGSTLPTTEDWWALLKFYDRTFEKAEEYHQRYWASREVRAVASSFGLDVATLRKHFAYDKFYFHSLVPFKGQEAYRELLNSPNAFIKKKVDPVGRFEEDEIEYLGQDGDLYGTESSVPQKHPSWLRVRKYYPIPGAFRSNPKEYSHFAKCIVDGPLPPSDETAKAIGEPLNCRKAKDCDTLVVAFLNRILDDLTATNFSEKDLPVEIILPKGLAPKDARISGIWESGNIKFIYSQEGSFPATISIIPCENIEDALDKDIPFQIGLTKGIARIHAHDTKLQFDLSRMVVMPDPQAVLGL